MNKQQLQTRFLSFVERLRAFSVLSVADREEESARLEGEYRALFGAFSRMGPKQVKQCMAVADEVNARELAEHLFFGREQIRNFHRRLTSLNLFSKDAGRTDWAISEFVTRHDAYLMIHKRETAKTQEETQRLLGAMLGVDGTLLSADFVKKVKGEMMGAVLAYTHARLCARDMERWERDKKLRTHYNNELGDYLTDCIQAANIPLYYDVSKEKNAVQEVACVFVEHGTDLPSSAGNRGTAPQRQADAFCVNHEEKLFVVGGSTVNKKFNAKQLVSIARHTRALQFLTENDERYKGYQVRPFVFHGGYFSTAPDAKDGAGTRFVTALREEGMSQPHIEALARMPFFHLLAEDHVAEDLGDVFSLLNTHVAGCNTLAQYQASELVRQGHPRAGAIAALQALEQAAEALASPAFLVGDAKDGLREALLSGLPHALINFYVSFPIKAPEKLSEEEQEVALRIGPHLKVIQKKIGEGSGFTMLDFLYEKLATQYTKKADLARLVKTRAETSQNKTKLVWSDEIYADLLKKKKVFDLNPTAVTNEALRSVVIELSNGTVPALLTEAITHCLAVNEGMDDNQMSATEKSLLEQVVAESSAMAKAAKKGKPVTPRESTGAYVSNEGFRQSLGNAIANTEWKTLYDPGLRLTASTFRFARALFQMSHDQLVGDAPAQAMDRVLPLFIRDCLAADSNPTLQKLALAHVENIRFEARRATRPMPKKA